MPYFLRPMDGFPLCLPLRMEIHQHMRFDPLSEDLVVAGA